jgi:predicted ribonuclease YlaK
MEIKAAALGIQTINYYENTTMPISCLKIRMSNKDLENFSDEMLSEYDVPIGQYIIVEDESGKACQIKKYFGEGLWESPQFDGIGNYLFSIKPMDAYQSCAIDSLFRDDMTVITGPAGTGKTLMSIAYCLQKIRNGARVHIFVNPVKTKNSEELGFYPGDRDEKLLQNFIGGILKNKIGDITEVEKLLEEGSLNLYPFSDIRGIEVGKGDIMYITEAQNLSVELMKLGIQRCAEGSKIIIEGDPDTQVDKDAFMNESNGLKRVIQVYTGDDKFSHVYLPNIYRSKLAERAERL